ncbi:MAG: haloacid dehalogenase type II [Burkholderiaceae bacterium]
MSTFDPASIEVLAFDVFGTVVDWHGSIAAEVDALGLGVPGAVFATAWRDRYQPSMHKVRSGELPWTKIDDLHRMNLDEVIDATGVTLDEAGRRSLNLVWHRLNPWPDSPVGLRRLRQRYRLATMSNGNLGLLADLSRHGGLQWDLILSAEVFRHYKPDPETYLGVCEVFDIEPAQMLMVAAHKDDLRAAAACGCRTAFIERPTEHGVGVPVDVSVSADLDIHARNLDHLGELLGCPPVS